VGSKKELAWPWAEKHQPSFSEVQRFTDPLSHVSRAGARFFGGFISSTRARQVRASPSIFVFGLMSVKGVDLDDTMENFARPPPSCRRDADETCYSTSALHARDGFGVQDPFSGLGTSAQTISTGTFATVLMEFAIVIGGLGLPLAAGDGWSAGRDYCGRDAGALGG
jgi:hypothetical protein